MASQKANIRRAWLAERIGDGTSDAKLIGLCAATFKISEATARKDLAEVYDHWIDVYEQMAPGRVAQFMELGLKLLEECREAGGKSLQYGPAVAQFKNLAIMAGVMREGLMGKQSEASGAGPASTRPSDEVIRERLSALKKDPGVRERALKLGLDLD